MKYHLNQGRDFKIARDTVPLTIRSVIGERNNVGYNACNARKLEAEDNLSHKSYTKRPVEVEV